MNLDPTAGCTMRLLLVDHGCCDPPATRVHRHRGLLAAAGAVTAACGPTSVPALEASVPGLHGIHLHDVAAANRRFLTAVRDGRPGAFLTATATLPTRLLGLVRETARQALAEAVDSLHPDAIFVFHAGILADLAIETGVPVALHLAAGDLAAAALGARVRDLVGSAVASAEWVGTDREGGGLAAGRPVPHAPLDDAGEFLRACATALVARSGRRG